MIRYLLAMPREADMLRKYADQLPKGEIEVIGINAVDYTGGTENDVLVNVGYAGGYNVPIGTLVEPSVVYNMATGDAVRIDPLFLIERRLCFTSDSFVERPAVNLPSVYDMELFKVAERPHKRLYAIKIVSDNLNEKDCEGFNDEASWKTAAALISRFVKEE